MLEHANDSNQHNPGLLSQLARLWPSSHTKSFNSQKYLFKKKKTEANTGNETHSKKSNSPYSTGANAATTQSINDRGTENTNPNMLCSDNERLLMLQRFASNNYCSSDESDDSFGTENKQSNQ